MRERAAALTRKAEGCEVGAVPEPKSAVYDLPSVPPLRTPRR